MKPDDLTELRVLSPHTVDPKKTANLVSGHNNSISNPPAQSYKLCEPNDQVARFVAALEVARLSLRKESEELYFILILQFENALRISEVLSISPTSIDNFGNVLIKAAKGSNNKIIPTGEARQYLLNCKRNNYSPFATFNRFYIYRVWKKYNLTLLMPDRVNNAVTHSARHLAAISARKSNFEESSLSSHLSHKSKNSTKRYGK